MFMPELECRTHVRFFVNRFLSVGAETQQLTSLSVLVRGV